MFYFFNDYGILLCSDCRKEWRAVENVTTIHGFREQAQRQNPDWWFRCWAEYCPLCKHRHCAQPDVRQPNAPDHRP